MHPVTQLGYLVFEVRSLDAWRSFAEKTLGLTTGEELASGGFTLRMDSYQQRFFVEPGELDDVACIGWQVADATTLDALAARLPGSRRGTPEECARRHVAALIKLEDPAGIPLELYCGPTFATAPTSPVVQSKFVADDLGLGHVVIGADDPAHSIAFYQDVLGFRLSDYVRCTYFGHEVDIAFFHVNARHHSLAIGKRHQKRMHHFLLEVEQVDDVGRCFDRALRSKVPIAQTLGKHPNDHMFSFYALTPSGFQFEYGHGGVIVDDAVWQSTVYDRISDWGHHPPLVFAPPRKDKAESR
jgi:2,3-dihydroxybiphenyl 1,2-dioxygenase